jgi:hypothetical protein
MGMKGRILLHLAAALAGWGIVQSLRLSFSDQSPHGEGIATHSAPAGKFRATVPADRPAGEMLLKRLAAGDSLPEVNYGDSALAERYAEALEDIGIDPATFSSSYPGFDPTRKDLCYSILQISLSSSLDWHGGHDGRDLRHAFRHGRMEAMEIHDIFAAELPILAGTDLIRRSLYDQIADQDPDRAEVLLEPLAVAEAAGVRLWAARAFASGFTLESFLALMRNHPEPEGDEGNGGRRDAWRDRTPSFLERHGGEYLRWVEQLPPGADRDAAAAALLDYLDPGDPALVTRFRSLIEDPDLSADPAPR